MLRDFANREELVTYIREQFPQAAQTDDYISGTPGGRKAAEAQLEKVNTVLYAKTRNYLTGAVTRLSPYIRHGVFEFARSEGVYS